MTKGCPDLTLTEIVIYPWKGLLPNMRDSEHRPRLGHRICVLEYRSASLDVARVSPGRPLLLARQEAVGRIELFVDPDWSEFVTEEDRSEIGVLLQDLAIRADEDPIPLMEQLQELSHGYLVTAATADDVGALPMLETMLSRFSKLYADGSRMK